MVRQGRAAAQPRSPGVSRCSWMGLTTRKRQDPRKLTSIVGPSMPTSSVRAAGPVPTISTGFSNLSRSQYRPGWTKMVS